MTARYQRVLKALNELPGPLISICWRSRNSTHARVDLLSRKCSAAPATKEPPDQDLAAGGSIHGFVCTSPASQPAGQSARRHEAQ
ncbi:MAG: hypothetical protein R2867_19745 [Caldilineaceae bacterium]